jgi:hypothetical protein
MPLKKLSQPVGINRPALLVTLLAVVFIGITAVYYSRAADQTSGGSIADAQLYLSSADSTLAVGQHLTVWLHANSGSVPVGAVQADLSYPADKLKFERVEDSGSAYPVKAEESGSDGRIHIARGTGSPITGDHMVATIVFTVQTAGTDATLSFLPSSVLVRSDNDTNIITATAGGTYHLSQTP